MNKRPALEDLAAFAAIAGHRSFRKAADELSVAPSSLSHLIRTLERRLGVRLLQRTTRSVTVTEAGERLLSRLRPVLRDFDAALDVVAPYRDGPSGTLRINSSEIGLGQLLEAAIGAFLERCPEMSLDLVTDGRLVDIVDEGFDAGIRLAEAVPKDMIGVPFGGDTRFVAVAAPTYLERHPPPEVPDDLSVHHCIRIRLPSGKRYRWEFERHGQEVVVDVPGTLTMDHIALTVVAAVRSLGIAYVPERAVRPQLERGELVLLLEDWCPRIPGLVLYYPGHRHVPAGLTAFIDVLREHV